MRFALTLSAVFALGALLAGAVAWVLQSQELSRRLEGDIAAIAQGFAATARMGDKTDLTEQIDAQARAVQDGSFLVAFVDAATGETTGNMRLDQPFAGHRRLNPGKDFTVDLPVSVDLPEQYYAFGTQTPLGWIMVARDDAWIVEGREIMLTTTAWGLGLALVLAFAFAVFIARRNEARIARIGLVLDEVGAGRTDLRIRETGNDDLARLAARMDVTLDRLEDGIAAIRQVSTDVAHDLRAPLARLRMRLEPQVLAPETPEEIRRELGAALVDLDGVAETFDAILRLSRLQSGMVEIPRAPVDLAALAAEIGEILRPTAEDMGHTLILDVPDTPAMTTGDGELITQAMVNLVDNALRHSPAPATVTVTVTGGARPSVTVADTGPGIPTQDRARVTDRFVRLDSSRHTAGTGLGLALVKTIAELHGATLTLDDNAPGLRAVIRFA